MESLTFSLSAYGFTILFAMVIASLIPGLAWVVHKLNLERESEAPTLVVPSSDAMKEEEAVAVVIAVAHLRGRQ